MDVEVSDPRVAEQALNGAGKPVSFSDSSSGHHGVFIVCADGEKAVKEHRRDGIGLEPRRPRALTDKNRSDRLISRADVVVAKRGENDLLAHFSVL